MDTLFGISLDRLKKGVGLEALKDHFNEFKSYSINNFEFESFDSLYDRRIDELKFLLYHRYINDLQNIVIGWRMLNGLYRIIFVGQLEMIKDYESINNSLNFLNRTNNEMMNFPTKKKYRIRRAKNDNYKLKLKDMWNFTVKKYFEEYESKINFNNEFFRSLVNLKNLKGFEMSDFEQYRNDEISKVKSEFLKFLTDSDIFKSIFLKSFKDREDYSVVSFSNLENDVSESLYKNLRDIFLAKTKMDQSEVEEKILSSDIFFTHYNKKFKEEIDSILIHKLEEALLREEKHFAVIIGEDIYFLNKKNCKLPFIYNKGQEDYINITWIYNKDETGSFTVSKDKIEYDLLDALRINTFDKISKIKTLELSFEYVNNPDLNKRGNVSFINLPESDEEYIVDEDNFIAVVQRLNPNFKWIAEEI